MADTLSRLHSALAPSYVVLRELGAGGMATVYLARDIKHEREVAIKVLHPDLGAALGGERFLAEIRTTARLQHPHILPLLNSGVADGLLYYVMPLVAGETLRARLDREKVLPIADAVRLAREVASALDYAHRQGVVHRDIKPENVLLHDGSAIVADFGIALAVQSAGGARLTQTGLSLGTPQYMSPEQAMGERTIDARSDLYALGAVTYEMLTGDPPFTGSTVQAIVAKVLTEKPVPPTTVRDTVPAHVEAAVLAMLAKLPADRPTSAKAFADALHAADASLRTAVMTAPARGAGFGTAILGASLTVSMVAAAWGWLRRAPLSDDGVTRFAVQLPTGRELYTSTLRRLAMSKDGREIVYAGFAENNDMVLLRRPLDDLRVYPIAGTVGAVDPSYSPDGRRIAFIAGEPRSLRTIDREGGNLAVLTDSVVQRDGISWGYDGYIYYVSHVGDRALARIPETGGKPETASTIDRSKGELSQSAPFAMPNGKLLVRLNSVGRSGAAKTTIIWLDPVTHRQQALVDGVAAVYSETGHLLFLTDDRVLRAVRFDPDKGTISGDARVIERNVAIRSPGRVELSIARGGRLAYTTGEGAERRALGLVDLNGRLIEIDTAYRFLSLSGNLRASRDGRRLLYSLATREASVPWIKNIEGGAPQRLEAPLNNGSFAWSPDERLIALGTATGLVLTSTDGRTLPNAVFDVGYPLRPAQFTNDGRTVIAAGFNNIVAVPIATGSAKDSVRVLVSTTNVGPRLSPDGRWLSYLAMRNGQLELLVSPYPNVGDGLRQVSTAGAVRALWAPDGKSLYYIDQMERLFRVPVVNDASITFGSAQLLLALPFGVHSNFLEIMPDGKRFVGLFTPGDRSTWDQLVVVDGLASLLRNRARP